MRGSCQMPASPAAAFSVRAIASSNSGFLEFGAPSAPPEMPKLDTLSTPPEMRTSASPALMACSAIRVVCNDDEQ